MQLFSKLDLSNPSYCWQSVCVCVCVCVLTNGSHVGVISVLIEIQIVEHDDLACNVEVPFVNCLYLLYVRK